MSALLACLLWTALPIPDCGLRIADRAPPSTLRNSKAATHNPPAAIVVATSRGEARVTVSTERGHPTLPLPPLSGLLPITHRVAGDWADVTFAGHAFRFLLGAPVLLSGERLVPLAGGAYVARDTLFVPLQWLADYIPRIFREAYRYDPLAARFEEARLQPVVRAAPAGLIRAPSALARQHGFRAYHKLVIDPGHGGMDGGNPGRYLPEGVREKQVTLAIGRRLRDELLRRGVEVVLTRDGDRFVPLADRARLCGEDCDLFVSIHVNSLPRRPGYELVSGLETYFLGESVTADAERVAQMENEALRYEVDSDAELADALSFILKDLHVNEYLRESALLAELIQRSAARVHPGAGRRVAQSPSFYVLRAARRPAALIETGFATNRQDARYLTSTGGQEELARAIADAIVAYLLQYEGKVLLDEASR